LALDIINKLGYSRGRQIVVSIDSNRIRQRAFMYQYKIHLNLDSFIVGENEIQMVLEKLDILLVKGKFKEEPYITADNYFSRDKIINFLDMKFINITFYY